MADDREVVSKRNEARRLGFVMVPMVILFDGRLNTTQKTLWGFLERYSGADGRCFPGVKRIAKGLGLSSRMVQTHLAKLEEVGLIRRRFRDGRSTEYEMQDMEDVYCDSDKRLLDSSLDMLRECGEESLVESLLAARGEPEDGAEAAEGEGGAPVIPDGDIASQELTEKPSDSKPRHEDVIAKINSNLKRSEEAAERRKERRKVLAEDPKKTKARVRRGRTDEDGKPILTTKDVEEEFRAAAKEKWPDNAAMAAPWEPRHLAAAKKLCDRFGHELTIKVLRAVVLNWEDYVDRFGFNGYPHVFLIAKFADSWFPEVDGGKNIDPLTPRERSRKGREYDEAASNEDRPAISYIRG